LVTKDGRRVPVEVAATQLRTGDGFAGVLVLARDVSGLRAVADALRRSQAQLAEAQRVARIGSWDWDLATDTIRWSEEMYRLSGVGMSEAPLGFDAYMEIIHPDDRDEVAGIVQAAIAAGGDFETRYRLAEVDGGERVIEGTGTVTRDTEGKAVWMAGTARDVTDEHRSRVERQRLEEEFLRAQKLEALALLSGEIAHDFNNALTAIRGYAALVLDQLDPDSPAARDALELCRTAEHATVLPRQLLAFARGQTPRSRELHLNVMLQELRPLLQHLLGVERSLVVPDEGDEVWVRADPGHLEQALVNVTLNARDALEDAPGTVTIGTRLVDLDEASASSLSLAPGRYGALTITDTGVGMDEETAAHAAEPFFTTKQDRGGTGLGLPAVIGGVTQSGGAVRITSEVGAGTTVEILLPVAERPVRSEPAPAAPDPARANATVVVVDDEPHVLAVIARVLEEAGYSVVAMPSAGDALGRLRDAAADVALLVTDLRMPDMSGLELATAARRSVPALRVLFLSGFPEDLPPEDAANLLPKPFSPEELVAAVEQRLAAPSATGG
jgi:two-component system cell cycle sensor histidine kinase/response regulator CckA